MRPLAIALGVGLGLTSFGSLAWTAPKERPSCRDLPASAWSASPLADAHEVRGIQELRPESPVSETERVEQRWGARIFLRAEPGVTAEWLQRIAECHLAQLPSAATSQSPLDVKGAAVTVQSTGDGFSVDVTSGDPKTGKEILMRARAMAPQPARQGVAR